MGGMDRAARRRAAREEEAQAKKENAVQRKVKQVGDLGTYVEGYRTGYVDAYFQALADLKGSNVVKMVATQIMAVHHDPEEQAKYVLDKFQAAMRPRNIEAMKVGIDRAVTAHLQKLGVLPTVDGEPPDPSPEKKPTSEHLVIP
jgi:hypothetical protein